MATYICKECGAPVEVNGVDIKRECGHDEAGVLANAEAKCKGMGGLKTGNALVPERQE
jgi:hypothetical protein